MPEDILILVNNPALAKPLQDEFKSLNLSSTVSAKISKEPFRYLIAIASEKPSLVKDAFNYSQRFPGTKTTIVCSVNSNAKPPKNILDKILFAQKNNNNPKLIFSGALVAPNYTPKSGPHFTRVSDLVKPILHDLFAFTHASVSESEVPLYTSNLDDSELALKKAVKPLKIKINLTRVHLSKKSILLTSLLLFWSLVLPFVLLFISAASLAVSVKSLSAGKFKTSAFLSEISRFTSALGETGFQIHSRFPVLNTFSESAVNASRIVESGASLVIRSTKLVSNSNQFINNIFTDTEFDSTSYSKELYFELDHFYRESSFLEANLKSFPKFLVDFMPQPNAFASYRQYLYSARELAMALPNLLGTEKSVTYLILFQNNMELRPTGGFIGSFALATFQNGKLIDLPVYDVYSADGQLKGFIRPPAPIADVLGEESWFMRDSNWDPDFAISAQRAEWFLDKTLDRTVDGVIAIDLNFLRDLLTIAGPIRLADFNDEITAQNFYQKIQYEVEADFFPGSRKKANYLGSLTSTLISKLTSFDNQRKLQLARILLNSLNSRSVQIYLHDHKAQNIAQVLGWSGEVVVPMCEGNCHVFWLGLVEANLGVNKANLFVKRQADVSVNIKTNIVENALVLKYQNTSTEVSKTPEYRYKNYLRLILPKDANIISVTSSQNNKTATHIPEITFLPDHIEAGILLDLPPKSNLSLSVNWTQPLTANLNNTPGQIKLFWRKQAGIESLPSTINLSFSSSPGLTDGKTVRYNTNLSQDFESSFSW